MTEEKGLKEAKVVINEDECKGCGLCIDVCPKEAISLKDVEQIGEEKRIDAVKRLFGDILKETEA